MPIFLNKVKRIIQQGCITFLLSNHQRILEILISEGSCDTEDWSNGG